MNIQKIHKPPPIHVAKDIPGVEDFVESLCGKWLNVDHYKVTTSKATCKRCLLIERLNISLPNV